MSEIKPLSLSPDPYPKARTHRQVSSKPTSPPRTTNNRPTLDLSYSYPTADRYTPGSSGRDADIDRMRQAQRQLKQAPPQPKPRQTVKKRAYPQTQPKPTPPPSSPRPAPPQSLAPAPRTAHSIAQPSSALHHSSPRTPVGNNMKKYQHELTLIAAAKKKNQASLAALEPPKPKPKPLPEATTPPKAGFKKKAFRGGAARTMGGGLDIGQGIGNILNGNTTEGSLQVAQGVVNTAEGIHGMRLAEVGIDPAKTRAGKVLGRLGSVANGGMVVYDSYKSYEAYKNGDSVAAAERGSSAVINAVSAFPPTAVVGMVGGLADWAMAASGADDLMVTGLHSLTASSRSHEKQSQQRKALALTMMATQSNHIRQMSAPDRRKLAAGITGLHELVKEFEAKNEHQKAQDVRAQIRRLKADISLTPVTEMGRRSR